MKTKIFRFLLLLFLLILFLGISSCGFLPSGSTSGDSLEHTCKFDDSWMANEVHHWHICRCGKTDEKVAHSGGIATETERAKCEVCGLSYGYLKQPESPKHECDFTGSYKFDGTHHWYECSCGEIDTKVEHSGGNATCTSLAICGVCGQEYGSLLNHEYIKLNHDETNHWYECECGEVKPNSIEEHSGGEATTEELAKCVVCKTPYGELEQPEELTIGEKIQAEYDALKAGTTTNHTTWTFKATIVDMTETKLNSKYNTYNVLFIAKVDDVLIGVYNGQVGGKYPTTIDGLTIGSVVTITGIIAEKYTMTSGSYSTNIEFSMPEISWTDSEIDEEKISEKVHFLMINDTHGAFLDSSEGSSIGRVDTLLDSLKSSNGDYIKIINGDAFQGSYVCGETYGLPMIEALNVMDFDCFVLGNHEFDWGIDKIAAYADGDLTNGEANFPFLGANIFYKGTTTRPDWIDAYTIVEYGDIKVGIIGIMGPGQESSILTRYIKDYEFADPNNIISENAQKLRSELGCSVVVVATHDYNTAINNKIAALTGESRIDAIFCAHTHALVNERLTRADGISIPVVQNFHKNVKATGVTINLDESNKMISSTVNVYTPSNYSISADVQNIINKYQELITISNQSLGSTSSTISESTLGAYAVDAMLKWSYSESNFDGIDAAIINTGGVRAEISSGYITRADVFEVFPFNNMVVLVNIKGSLIKSLYSNNKNYLYVAVTDSIGSYSNLNDNTIYQLAVIDYVFENTRYTQFNNLSTSEYLQTDVLMRDILIEYIDEKY